MAICHGVCISAQNTSQVFFWAEKQGKIQSGVFPEVFPGCQMSSIYLQFIPPLRKTDTPFVSQKQSCKARVLYSALPP